MKKYAKSIWVWIIWGIFLPVCHAQECLTKFPEECNPERIGLKLAERFLASGHMSPRLISYPEVCTWYGALRFADVTNNKVVWKHVFNHFIRQKNIYFQRRIMLILICSVVSLLNCII